MLPGLMINVSVVLIGVDPALLTPVPPSDMTITRKVCSNLFDTTHKVAKDSLIGKSSSFRDTIQSMNQRRHKKGA